MKETVHEELWAPFRKTYEDACQRGDLLGACAILETALKKCQQVGELDNHVVQSIHEVAWQYCAQRKYPEAECLYLRVLQAREKLLGPYHQDVADSLERLAVVLRQLKRSEEASTLEFRAKSIGGRYIRS
jgi:hypothetical protein